MQALFDKKTKKFGRESKRQTLRRRKPARGAGKRVPQGRCPGRQAAQKSRVKAEKTKIFFQKASSGFGDVSFKERSGRFKA